MNASGCLVLATLSWCAFASLLRGAESQESREIKARFARQVGRIESLDVWYKLETKTDLTPEQLLSLPEHHNQLFLPEDEWHEAFKGQKRYRRQIQPERITYLAPVGEFGLVPPSEPAADAPGPIKENQKRLKAEYDRAVANMKTQEIRGVKLPRIDPAIRPLSERDVTRAFNGRTLWMKQPNSQKNDRYMIWPTKSPADWFQVSAYLSAIGLHVPDPSGRDMAKRAQAMFRLAEWLKDSSYGLESGTEVVDGSTCVILKGSLNSLLEPKPFSGDLTDRVWLDRDHGLVVRKREMARDGKIMARWINTNLKEVEPGIWLPMSAKHETFAAKPPAGREGKPDLTEVLRVQRLEINRVPDGRFDMVPKQGDHIEDLRGRS
jgi:hypothetical protein